MGKNKLSKFADMRGYENVYEYPHRVLAEGECPLRGKWAATAFGNNSPLTLELGCGRGEYALGLAGEQPSRNFIGVDIKGARMWTGATQALRQGIANVAFLRTEIENIDRIFAPGEVDCIWLTFSDPQMKHVRKRMTSTYFLERYRRILRDGGTINVKTDSNFLFTYTRHMAEANGLPVSHCCDDIYANAATLPPEATGIRTYYEEQWLGRGIAIKFISMTLPHEGTLREPETDIPLDSYRSYNRHKRSSLATSR